MNLDSTTLKLEAVLGGSVSTTQPVFHVFYYDIPSQTKNGNEEYRGATNRGALNNTTDVTLCAAPGQVGTTRVITQVNLHNADTASVTVTIKTDDGTTERTLIKITLTTLQTLTYSRKTGWVVI